MFGFDINPLAVLISSVKFTKVSLNALLEAKAKLREEIFEFAKNEQNSLPLPNITNLDFWFSKMVSQNLTIIKYFIDKIAAEEIKRFFLLPFSETVREGSFTRNNEFKLYKMKSEDILTFNPDVLGVYFKKLNDTLDIYATVYLPKLTENIKVEVRHAPFQPNGLEFEVVLTSPPYGDSRTTVAYGQFSTLSNEWTGIDYARKIDGMLMGGVKAKQLYTKGVMADCITEISQENLKRALEVSSFYEDLGVSIGQVARSVKKGGKVIYVVGNRTVKNMQLPTDQFIAEQFEENGFKHLITYQRNLSNKSMPSKNSPTNKTGKTVSTMLHEYIVISEKE